MIFAEPNNTGPWDCIFELTGIWLCLYKYIALV